MPRTADTYPEEIVILSKSAMLELWRSLHRYNKGMTLIGGWVPYFLLEKYGGKSYEHDHVGSIDIDIALNKSIISKEEYANIEQLMQNLGYRHKMDSDKHPIPFVFLKDFPTSNTPVTIEVDFVGSYYGTKGHRHQRVRGLLARKCHGVDIVFDNYIEERIKGQFPKGGNASETVRITNFIASLTMKGIVLGERYKEKDAYDIYYLITYFKNGPVDAAKEINPYIKNDLVNEAITTIKKDFDSRESSGPSWVASFLNEVGDERERRITDVYMNVNEFLKSLKENKN